jgi:hypothetical protein
MKLGEFANELPTQPNVEEHHIPAAETPLAIPPIARPAMRAAVEGDALLSPEVPADGSDRAATEAAPPAGSGEGTEPPTEPPHTAEGAGDNDDERARLRHEIETTGPTSEFFARTDDRVVPPYAVSAYVSETLIAPGTTTELPAHDQVHKSVPIVPAVAAMIRNYLLQAKNGE